MREKAAPKVKTWSVRDSYVDKIENPRRRKGNKKNSQQLGGE